MKTAFSCTLNAIIRGSLCSGIDQFPTLFLSFGICHGNIFCCFFLLSFFFFFPFSFSVFFLFPFFFFAFPFFFFFLLADQQGGHGHPVPPLATPVSACVWCCVFFLCVRVCAYVKMCLFVYACVCMFVCMSLSVSVCPGC